MTLSVATMLRRNLELTSIDRPDAGTSSSPRMSVLNKLNAYSSLNSGPNKKGIKYVEQSVINKNDGNTKFNMYVSYAILWTNALYKNRTVPEWGWKGKGAQEKKDTQVEQLCIAGSLQWDLGVECCRRIMMRCSLSVALAYDQDVKDRKK